MKIQYNDRLKTIAIFSICLLVSMSGYGQNRLVTGKVASSDGEGIIGVNILEKGRTSGIVSDLDGSYSINVSEDTEALIFSFIGYQTQELSIVGISNLDVVLEPERYGLEEIVVSARKLIENVQEVPLSVSAFSARMLEQRGVSNVSQLGDFIPNVEIDVTAPFSGSQSVLSPYIRGIGQIDFAITYEPAVGLYVDGVYFGRTVGSIIDMLDVERIEALKGPQGTLFGRNTIGGALNITTKRPSDELSVSGSLTTGSFNRLDTKVSVDIPLSKKLLTSFSVSSINRDGHMKRIPFVGDHNGDLAVPGNDLRTEINLDGDQGNQNNDTWRAKILYEPSEKFRATINADYERVRENQNASKILSIFGQAGTVVGAYNACTAGVLPPQLCNAIDGAPGLELIGATPYDNRFITDDPFTNFATDDAGTKIDAWGTSLTLEWALGENVEFKSITAYRSLESIFAEDQDFSPINFGNAGFVMPQDQFTQEFQFTGTSDKFKWIAGLYHFQEDGSVLDQVFLGRGLVQIYGLNLVNNKSYAAFSQASYGLTDKWSVTGGLRFTHEVKKLDGRQRDLNSFFLKAGLVTPDDFPTSDLTLYYPPGVNEQTFSVPTFRIGTEYKASENVFFYGYFAQGFKSGGWTTRVTSPVLEAPTFNPEKANTYEIGFKSDFAQNTFRLNAAAFYTDYQDLQITVQRGITPFVVNAAQADITGLELDLQWRPSQNFIMAGNLGLIDAKYTEILEAGAAVNENSTFVNTPSFSSAISADYTIPTGKGGNGNNIILHVDLSSKSEVANDVENTPLLIQPGITLLNASISLESKTRNWKITAGGTNITNQTYLIGGYTNPGVGITYGTYARPAEFNIGITFNL